MSLLIVLIAKYFIVLSILGAFLFACTVRDRKRIQALAVAVIALPLAYVIAKMAASMYSDPRPFVVGNFTPLIPHAADNGFPSDHVLLTAAIASVVAIYDRRLGIALWLLAIVIGIARVLAGLHHPIDIVASALIAAVAAFVGYLIARRLVP